MAEERFQRRLAAILAADVVGYSRLMGSDETGTLERLKALRRDVFAPAIAEFGGRIFKLTGDGAFAEFGSAADAVSSAVAVQRALAGRNAESSDDRQIALRIGISLGDVIVEGSDLYGHGVNVAARMEGLAEPGGICISGNVYEHVGQSRGLAFEDLGDQTVKNIERPVRCYRVHMEGSESSEVGAQAPVFTDKPSIAVLPFVNMSGDPEQEYFSDGMAEDLITDLSKISGLLVVARNSSFAFKGKPSDVKEIAKSLGVRHILEGSVRKMGSKLRVNAQLIDGTDGGHIWAERYDGNLEDIFQFQDDIREQIVSALRVSLSPADQSLAARKPTDSVEAYDLFLQGRAHYHRFTPEDLLKAKKCFEKAIEIDPNFADAYGYLSYCHFQGWASMRPGFDDTLDRALELAERGVALDPTSAIALTRLGWIQCFLRRYDQAIVSLEEALALAPENAEVNATLAMVLNYLGKPERALQLLEKALNLEMFAPPNWQVRLGMSHLLLGQYDEALVRFKRAAPTKFYHAYINMAWAYVELDRTDEARSAIKTLLEIIPHYTVALARKFHVFRIDEVRDRLVDALRKAGLPEG